ncbi:PDZ domain-containing protein [Wenzhouxiangella sp. AB-CW3]|uniref:S41 family peptidase n=1 Tax=Wenzhouxiangella sp. AB-CW3 TaxID=2771012 RepID=UPI00168AB515|nr:S41 family peptidase [Wenzhouxiangella sp. AB-CW3]QOC22432.1 PDZ domain-containing protein [Wenzhouxiangella sp. AB-CW3]
MTRKTSITLCALLLAGLIVISSVQADDTRLLRQPAISADHIAFVYAGDLWLAERDGSNPRRLTSSEAEENNPHFSPDGRYIAFAGHYEGNADVHVISVDGGQPQRLTWHPGDDIPVGWSADGSAVAFASRRETDHGRSAQLFHVPVDGGAPVRQMEARFFRGRWDASGDRLAYIDFGPAYNGLYGGNAGWRGYRGGTTPSIRILEPESGEVSAIPGERVNDILPFWLDDQVVFVSDREDQRFNLFRFDPAGNDLEQLTEQEDWDIRWAAGHTQSVIFEAGGRLHKLDLANGEQQTLTIHIQPDLPQTRPGWKNVRGNIEQAGLSPNGKRALITARGEVFTVPVEDGSTRNLTRTDGVREYTALWSPDGEEIAWVVESREGQTLVVTDQRGMGDAREYELGPDFYRLQAWDADNGRIVFTDNLLGLHAISLDDGQVTEIDRQSRQGGYDVALSPDGQWLAYTRRASNYFRDLVLYHFDDERSVTVTDGMADVASPAFSRDGKFLYLAASTNSGPRQFSLDMSSQERPYRAGLYALVLEADGESPLAPRTGDEEAGSDTNKDNDDADEARGVNIDLDGLFSRKVALPVEKGNHGNLTVAADGSLYWMQRAQPGATVEPPGESVVRYHRLRRFDFDERSASRVYSGLQSYNMSAGGEHVLVRRDNGQLAVGRTGDRLSPDNLDLSGLRMHVDPRAEWAQIFDEGWRFQRDYFYAENLHGLDWDAVYEQYRPLLDHVGRREDLNDLMVEMIAELMAGHNRVSGGDVHRPNGPSGGLLGANFSVANNRWRIDRIYTGEAWNPFVDSPLAKPGQSAREGEYILAIDGRDLSASDNLFARLQDTAGKQIVLTVGPDAGGDDAREIVVEPVSSENGMRLWHWVEKNRRLVDEATDGRVGYIYLPNTAGPGYTFFNRMFHAQLDREALIIDERANGGGQAANYIVEVLSRRHLSNWVYRQGEMSTTPMGALHGPKLMMIDQDAGSGGDFLPYAFRELEIGPLLGTRTWGGLIGIFSNPPFVDGGVMTVPHFRFVDVDNNWSVENEGVAPDIHVELDPAATNAGRDSQLERAIEEILDMLEDYRDDIPREAPPLPTRPGH